MPLVTLEWMPFMERFRLLQLPTQVRIGAVVGFSRQHFYSDPRMSSYSAICVSSLRSALKDTFSRWLHCFQSRVAQYKYSVYNGAFPAQREHTSSSVSPLCMR